MTELLDSLAFNIRRLRDMHGLSLSQLGEKSGVAKGTLFKVERGQTNPNLDTLQAIAQTFEVPVTELLTPPEVPSVEIVPDGEGCPGRGDRTRVLSADARPDRAGTDSGARRRDSSTRTTGIQLFPVGYILRTENVGGSKRVRATPR